MTHSNNIDDKLRQIQINEQILRYVAQKNVPVIVKGSYLHARVFPNALERLKLSDGPDFVAINPYDQPLTTTANAKEVLEQLGLAELIVQVEAILAQQIGEAVTEQYEIFIEKDFSTIRLRCTVGNHTFCYDFSLHSDSTMTPVSMEYFPLEGESFVLPRAASLENQIGWKLSQCILRVRAKDLVDLSYMLSAVELQNPQSLRTILQSAIDDCFGFQGCMGVVPLYRLLSGDFTRIFEQWGRPSAQRGFLRKGEPYESFFPSTSSERTSEPWEFAPRLMRYYDVLRMALEKTFYKIDWQTSFYEIARHWDISPEVLQKPASKEPEPISLNESNFLTEPVTILPKNTYRRLRLALFTAIRLNNSVSVRHLVEQERVDIQFPDKFGWTALIIAVREDNISMARYLLEQGAEVNFPDNKNQTPLFHAKSEAMKELLLSYGACESSTLMDQAGQCEFQFFAQHIPAIPALYRRYHIYNTQNAWYRKPGFCTDLTLEALRSHGIHIKMYDLYGYVFFRTYLQNSGKTILEIPQGVTNIRSYAFRNCTSLTAVVIPEGVTEIGDGAFEGCTSLTSVVIPEGVTSIGESAFDDCTSLTSVVIPASVTRIASNAFAGCTSLKSVVISKGVTTIEKMAFMNCTSLTSVVIPESVTVISGYAFEGCTSLTHIIISEMNPSYQGKDGMLLSKDGKSLIAWPAASGNVLIPDDIKTIGWGAFYGHTSLTSVVIPEGVTTIGDYAFVDCTSLTSVVIPKSVTTIGDYAFRGCKSLTISSPAGSCAQKYAKERNIPFTIIK